MNSIFPYNEVVTLSTSCPSGDEKVILFGLLLETNARLSRDFAAELEKSCDLPLAWFDVLLQLHQSDNGRLKMSQIADAIVHSSGGTTRLIDRLEEAHLVRREHCAADRRAIWVAITDEGTAKLEEALAVHVRYLEENLATRLDGTERQTLRDLLGKLNAPR
ncbi:MAG TPA: MarR family transcriptional regulator [Acidimicrobiales bacterium]|jgi:DNA-binding MarR family transcriptional regulator|nr:MarR family transcriptional regulator [Acidimicrobiales bacterium]